MCYYNGVKVTRTEHIRLKNLEKAIAGYDFLANPLQIGFDYGNCPVLKRIPGVEDFEIVKMEWGLIPFYLKNRKEVEHFRSGGPNHSTGRYDTPILTLNAIGEEMLKKPTYKNAALNGRCLVLSTGFYEWRHIFPIGKQGKPLKTAVKYPYYIRLTNKNYFFMAGIWQPWTDQETGEHVESFSIVTTKANKLMEQIHNSKKRMPAILTEELAFEWIFGEIDEKRIAEIAAFQYCSEEMEACTISKDFRTALDPAEPFSYEELPALEFA
jgi:putative SOS response-associated peptidase YedK